MFKSYTCLDDLDDLDDEDFEELVTRKVNRKRKQRTNHTERLTTSYWDDYEDEESSTDISSP